MYHCRHVGCPQHFVWEEPRNRHENQKHVKCSCGRMFTLRGMACHLSSAKRKNTETHQELRENTMKITKELIDAIWKSCASFDEFGSKLEHAQTIHEKIYLIENDRHTEDKRHKTYLSSLDAKQKEIQAECKHFLMKDIIDSNHTYDYAKCVVCGFKIDNESKGYDG